MGSSIFIRLMKGAGVVHAHRVSDIEKKGPPDSESSVAASVGIELADGVEKIYREGRSANQEITLTGHAEFSTRGVGFDLLKILFDQRFAGLENLLEIRWH